MTGHDDMTGRREKKVWDETWFQIAFLVAVVVIAVPLFLAYARSDVDTDRIITGYAVIAIAIGVYFLPTIVAHERKVPSFASIAVLNLFLGWTLIGWVAALALAVRSVPRESTVPTPAPAAAPSPDVTEGLASLAKMREQGLLTEDEFTEAKSRLLAK